MRFITKINGLFDRIPYALVAVFARIVAAHPFFASGQTKIDGPTFGGVFHGLDLTFKFPISLRDAAFTLFEEEHKLPLIPPDLAATLATIAENLLPVLLVLGLATRLSALGLLVMTVVIQFFVYPDAYSLGISARSHLKAVFSSAGRERLLFSAPPDVVAMASVDDKDDLTLTQTIDGGFEVLCAFPKAGKYTLKIFAARKDAAESYAAVMEYMIQASAGVGESAYFPATYNVFGTHGVTLVAPLAGRLAAGTTVEFSLSVPRATKVSVISGGKWTSLTLTGETFKGKVAVKAGEVQVCASFPDSSGYEGLMSYRAR